MEARAGFDGHARGLRAGAMSGDAGEMAFLGPAAIAVHDNGDVAREAGKIEFFEQVRFFGGDGTECFWDDEMAAGVGHDGFRVNPLYGAKLTRGGWGMQLRRW